MHYKKCTVSIHMFVIFYNISTGCRKTGIVQKILAFKMWVKFIVSLLKHLNNQKYNHNKGLCKKNEYCKGSFIVNENTVLWIGQNAQYT